MERSPHHSEEDFLITSYLDLTMIFTFIKACIFLGLTKKVFWSNYRKYFSYLMEYLEGFFRLNQNIPLVKLR
jgi:hypothetical protein